MLTKFMDLFLSLLLLFNANAFARYTPEPEAWNTNYNYVFVHGLSGWGSYDPANVFVRYWGMFSADIFGTLEKQGFRCYAASVDPTGSAWDRACELYAQLTGTRVDYGKAHSEQCNHKRYGRDYARKALVPAWNAKDKINLLGHSFGGVTVRLLAELMANGSEEERAATAPGELSPLFAGGKADWIYSITTLSAPHNGTTAYDITNGGRDVVGPTNDNVTGVVRSFFSNLINIGTQPLPSTRAEADQAKYDMFIDNAIAINNRISTLEDVYYFSVATVATDERDGVQVPDRSIMEEMFVGSSELIGKFEGETPGGLKLDAAWQPNDGLVNVISGRAPFGAPAQPYDADNVPTGAWNVLPDVRGDHMTFMGGLTKRNPSVTAFFSEHLDRINKL